MAQGSGSRPPSAWRRRAALVAVVAGVLLAHALVTRGVMGQMEALSAEGPTIKRMEAVMVADMRLSAPPVVAARLPSPPAALAEPAAPPAAPAASKPASAPESGQAASEAMVPEVQAAASQAAEPAASEPVVAAAEPASAASTPEAFAPVVAAASAAIDDAKPFEWPLATRVTFKAEGYIRGPIYGQAQVEWVRQDMRYQVRVDASVGPSFAPLGSQRWTSEGDITPAGLVPRRFESINKLLISSGTPRRVTFHTDEVELSDGHREPKLPLVQDPASHYIQLAYMALLKPDTLKVGGTLSMPLAWTKQQDTVVYDIEAQEALDTPLGKIDTFRLKPRPLASQKEREKERGEVLAEIWIAPSLQYLPIRMLLRQGKVNYVDMKMDKMPQQAAAPSQVTPPVEK
jgi:hypothetical protein